MAKTKSNPKGFNKIIVYGLSVFLLIVLLINLGIIVKLIELRKQKYSEIYSSENILSEQQKEHFDKLEEIKLLSEKIENIKNVEDLTENIRKEFFENAKKYETMVSQGKGSKKIAYLTLDDGPYNYTPAFLDVLDKYDILATFFLLGKPSSQYDATYKRIILRFPGGSSSALPPYRHDILQRLRKYNYGYIDWNVSSGDAGKEPSKEKAYNNIINGSRNKNIIVILMHDSSKASLLALPSVIETLKERDYIFLPLFYESSMIIK